MNYFIYILHMLLSISNPWPYLGGARVAWNCYTTRGPETPPANFKLWHAILVRHFLRVASGTDSTASIPQKLSHDLKKEHFRLSVFVSALFTGYPWAWSAFIDDREERNAIIVSSWKQASRVMGRAWKLPSFSASLLCAGWTIIHLLWRGRLGNSRSFLTDLAPVVQRLDNAIQRINRYPVDKCWQNKPRYPLDSDLTGG